MNTPAPKKKLSLKERYVAMTRDLSWETTYQPMEKVFPYDRYEGIRIHDWDKWEDPFRLTMDSYWKYQGEKEKKLYAVIDAFAQNNGHLGISDGRYVNAIKLFIHIQGVTPVEYGAHRGFAHLGRQFTGAGARVACQMQSVDELRHYQTETHAMSHYNRHFNGMHMPGRWFDRIWYLSVPKSFFEDAFTSGTLRVPDGDQLLLRICAHQPPVRALHVGRCLQRRHGHRDLRLLGAVRRVAPYDARHRVHQVPAGAGRRQCADRAALDRQMVLARLPAADAVAMMQDYMLPRRVMSWKEAWEMYAEANGGALFKDLARYGIREPKGWKDACEGKGPYQPPGLGAVLPVLACGRVPHLAADDREREWAGAEISDQFRPLLSRPLRSLGRDETRQGRCSTNTCRCCAKSARCR